MKKIYVIIGVILFMSIALVFARKQTTADVIDITELDRPVPKEPIKKEPLKPVEEKTVYATARNGVDICQEEQQAIKTRKKIIIPALEKITGLDFNEENVPEIGIVCSGGGFRAAIATLGLLRGLEHTGLLDTTTHIATCSGSTWAPASLIAHQTSIDGLIPYLRANCETSFVGRINMPPILSALTEKLKRVKQLTMADIFGGLLGYVFLRTKEQTGQKRYLSDSKKSVLSGSYPIPVYTSLFSKEAPAFEWFEFTPFEVGSSYFKTWIPTEAFGKTFENGTSFDPTKEETLSFMMGLWGSAFALSPRILMSIIIKSLSSLTGIKLQPDQVASIVGLLSPKSSSSATKHQEQPKELFPIKWSKDGQFSPPLVNNFAYGIEGVPYSEKQVIVLNDSGFENCLPFKPLFRRNTKIYIVCDASDQVLMAKGNELPKIKEDADRLKKPFPNVDVNEIIKKPLSILQNPNNPDCPLVIYIANQNHFSTLKFNYDNDEFDKLMGGIENTIVENEKEIKEAITAYIKRTYKIPQTTPRKGPLKRLP